jgi:glycosyltransferase involved in cell wall biosynthesis
VRFVNWTNQLAIHQSALMRAVVEIGWEATIVVSEPVSPDRLAMGWIAPNFGEVGILMNPDRRAVDALLQMDPERTVHMFGAALGYPWGRYALYRAARLGRCMGIMSEASDPDGWKAPLRWVKHTAIATVFGQRIQFVLAMGELGVWWFRHCGYPTEKVFPFGYFVERPPERIDTSSEDTTRKSAFHILYIGQLVRRKRVDLLMRALGMLPPGSVELTVVGDGPERTRLQTLATKLGVAQATNWLGALPHQDVRKVMIGTDLLVLPSRFDGWGAAVNEALMAGTPVICSDHCGAADLVRETWRGEVVHRNDPDVLAAAIRRRLEEGPVTNQMRERIRTWAECITGESAAQYLRSVSDHIYGSGVRPTPPWYRTAQ